MAFTNTTTLNDQVQAAFETTAYFALRSQPLFEMVADVRSTSQTHNGSSVKFTFYDDMDQNITALGEEASPTAVALTDTQINVPLAEYGAAVNTTALVRGTSFLNVDADAANIVGYNMADSLDKIVSNVANAGTHVIHVGQTSRGAIVAGNIYDAQHGRKSVARLRVRKAPGWENGNYMAIIHPDVSYDLRNQAPTAGVTDIINYQVLQNGAAIRAGSIGTFNGIEYIENPRAGLIVNGGNANVDVYQTLICGRQGLAKAFSRAPGFSEEPSIVFGPVVDTLRRFNPVGWYHLVGYGRFREDALDRVESSSSIGAN